MNILGISCFCHDSAACLLRDGKIIAAASEERFNRQKNSSVFPTQAINFCLQKADLTVYDIDYLGFHEKPFLKFSRSILAHLKAYPFSFKNFMDTLPYWLKDRLITPLVFKQELGYAGKVLFIKHHLAHAASSFLVSPFEEAVILTADSVGEWATTTYGTGRGNNIEILKEIRFPDSLGLLYTAVTTYLGFETLEGEGKVMGLASYGKPGYLDKFKQVINIHPDASFSLDQRFFGFNRGSRMYNASFVKLFGRARKAGEGLKERHYDIAASLQKITEDILIGIARRIHQELKLDKLCLAGGLFLNCVANNRILEETPFRELFIQPAAGDGGGALGVTSYIYNSMLKNRRNYIMTDAYLGPDFFPENIRRFLLSRRVEFKELGATELSRYIAAGIAGEKIIGWFQGRMEFGPRALGNRSILADPRNPKMNDLLNSKVKHREPFRPYAPAVLEERAGDFFQAKQFSPFMLLAAKVRLDKKSLIPAVTHVDGSARVQIVKKETSPKFWLLIKEFENLTGVPVLINTSFNLRGQPIVCTPEDALNAFQDSRMDCLVLENFVIERS
ncbi:MAG: carbamoyltransferase [Candidatus Omnitrophica bacterium]|jgi:carbamoyltransferase|nr:carbamoyltransferase [Candidatus Omnitrophota bacterium]